MATRACRAVREDHQPCRAAPLREHDYCLFHSPDHQEDAAEARRLGGQRRRRERIVSGAFDIEGLDSVAKIRRLVEVAALDTLGMENSVARSRTLIAVAQAALRLLEVGELEQRVASLEAVVTPRLRAIGGRRR